MRTLCFVISMLTALVAVVLLIADGAASVESGQIAWTSGEQFVARLTSTQLIERIQSSVSNKLHVVVWRALHAIVLTPPALLVAGALSLIFFLPTRTRHGPPLRHRRDEI